MKMKRLRLEKREHPLFPPSPFPNPTIMPASYSTPLKSASFFVSPSAPLYRPSFSSSPPSLLLPVSLFPNPLTTSTFFLPFFFFFFSFHSFSFWAIFYVWCHFSLSTVLWKEKRATQMGVGKKLGEWGLVLDGTCLINNLIDFTTLAVI